MYEETNIQDNEELPLPCKPDHNGECLVCDEWLCDCPILIKRQNKKMADEITELKKQLVKEYERGYEIGYERGYERGLL